MMVVVKIAADDITAPTPKSMPPPISTMVWPADAKLKSSVSMMMEPIALALSDAGEMMIVIR